MKKIKNILLMSVMAVCSFAFTSVVYAAAFTMDNMEIVCKPDTIEGGGQTECYIIGQPNPRNGTTESVHGYVAQAYTTSKYTTIVTAKSNSKIPNTGVVETDAGDSTSKPFSGATVPAAIKDFNCQYDSSLGTKKSDFKCVVYFSKGDKNEYTPASVKTGASNILDASKTADGYGIIGSLVIKLSDDVKVNECGQLCAKVWRIPNQNDYANYKTCQTKEPGEAGCTDTTGADSVNYVCKEIHLKNDVTEPGPPPTGAFASYAILAAGALIAISAVTMAKKNNKFNRI